MMTREGKKMKVHEAKPCLLQHDAAWAETDIQLILPCGSVT
jgi:hypothetical protein